MKLTSVIINFSLTSQIWTIRIVVNKKGQSSAALCYSRVTGAIQLLIFGYFFSNLNGILMPGYTLCILLHFCWSYKNFVDWQLFYAFLLLYKYVSFLQAISKCYICFFFPSKISSLHHWVPTYINTTIIRFYVIIFRLRVKKQSIN